MTMYAGLGTARDHRSRRPAAPRRPGADGASAGRILKALRGEAQDPRARAATSGRPRRPERQLRLRESPSVSRSSPPLRARIDGALPGDEHRPAAAGLEHGAHEVALAELPDDDDRLRAALRAPRTTPRASGSCRPRWSRPPPSRSNSARVMRGMRLAGSFTSRSTPGVEVTRTSASAPSAPASWLATVSPLMLSACPCRVAAEAGEHRDVAPLEEVAEERQVEAGDVADEAEVDRVGPGALHDARRAAPRLDDVAARAVEPDRHDAVREEPARRGRR